MGQGPSTRTSIDVVNDAIANVIISNANKCSQTGAQSQVVYHSGIGLFSGASQEMTLSANCVQNVTIDINLANDIASKIQQDAKAEGVALLDMFSNVHADAQAKLATRIQNNLKLETVQACNQFAIQQQVSVFTGTQIGSQDSQRTNQTMQCIQNAISNTKIANTIVNDSDQKASATSKNPLAFLTDWMAGLFSGPGIMVMIMVLIIVVAAIYMYNSGSGTQGMQPGQPGQPGMGQGFGSTMLSMRRPTPYSKPSLPGSPRSPRSPGSPGSPRSTMRPGARQVPQPPSRPAPQPPAKPTPPVPTQEERLTESPL